MDYSTFDETPVLPEDAGEYADNLLEIMNRIPAGWGRWISCGKGWYPLIIETHKKMLFLCPEYEIHQIKEKFGELRFYWGVPYQGKKEEVSEAEAERRRLTQEIMYDVESHAENRSRMICELCGKRGTTRKQDYWYKTLCGDCAVEHGYPLEDWEKPKTEQEELLSSKETT